MATELFAVRELTMQRLLADPLLIWQLIAPDEPEMAARCRSQVAEAHAEGGNHYYVERPR
jgi:hypothetical protein